MVVEPESYCWSSGRSVEQRDGPTWAQELQPYSSLEYVVRDGGSGLSKGIALVRAERPELKDGLDVFHTLYEGAALSKRTEPGCCQCYRGKNLIWQGWLSLYAGD